MNLLRKDIKNIICKMASGLDDNFFKEGFARRKNGLVYTRKIEATVDKGIHDKSTKIELPTLYKVPPKRDYGRYFCISARKEEPSHRGLMKSQAPFFMPKIRR